MASSDNALVAVGVVLQVLLLWRCLLERLWRYYPLFFCYVLYTLLRTVSLVVLGSLGSAWFALVYWWGNFGAVLLWFSVALEVYRHAFSHGPKIRAMASRAVLVFVVVLGIVFILFGSRTGDFFLDLQRKSGLIVVTLLGFVLLLARYYRIAVSSNIWGMAIGLGLFVSISIANFALFEMESAFFPFWRLLNPLSFIGMLLIWLCTLWRHTPAPQPDPVMESELSAEVSTWEKSWARLRPTIRKTIDS